MEETLGKSLLTSLCCCLLLSSSTHPYSAVEALEDGFSENTTPWSGLVLDAEGDTTPVPPAAAQLALCSRASAFGGSPPALEEQYERLCTDDRGPHEDAVLSVAADLPSRRRAMASAASPTPPTRVPVDCRALGAHSAAFLKRHRVSCDQSPDQPAAEDQSAEPKKWWKEGGEKLKRGEYDPFSSKESSWRLSRALLPETRRGQWVPKIRQVRASSSRSIGGYDTSERDYQAEDDVPQRRIFPWILQ